MFSWITITWTRWSLIVVWNICSEWSPLMSPCQVLQQPSPQVRLTKLLKYCQQTQCLNLKKELNTWNENAVCYLVNSQPVGWKTTYGIQNTQRSIFKNLIASPLILSFLRSDGRAGEVTGLRGDVDTIRLLVATHFSSWLCISKQNGQCLLDQFTKTFFWNFQSIRADLCYILIYKQMLEKAFCSNIAPSLSSGSHLFYKAKYMGRSCPNQV